MNKVTRAVEVAVETVPCVICGGTDKKFETAVYEEAVRRMRSEMEYHPCGCGVCAANSLLDNVRKLREEWKGRKLE